jgi:hypothetical protein
MAHRDYFISINKHLNPLQRLELLNALLNDPISQNRSYTVDLHMFLDPTRKELSKFDKSLELRPWRFCLDTFRDVQAKCKLCEYLRTGVCNSLNDSMCLCFTGFTDNLCQTTIDNSSTAVPSVTRAPFLSIIAANWTLIVAVASTAAGLLLIIAIALCACYWISRRSHRHKR